MEEDWGLLHKIASQATKRWYGLTYYEEVYQEALFSAWRDRDKAIPLHQRVYFAKRDAVDCLRMMIGKPGSSKAEGRKATHRYADMTILPIGIVASYPSDSIYKVILDCLDNPEHQAIIVGLIEDKPKEIIAKSLGITPSALSHRLTAIRKKLAESGISAESI